MQEVESVGLIFPRLCYTLQKATNEDANVTPGYADDKSRSSLALIPKEVRKRLEERAGVAAGLRGTGGASGLLEPGNELVDGELLGEGGGAGARAR